MSQEVDPSSFGTEASEAAAAGPERQPELEPGGRHAVAEGHADPTSSTDALWDALSSTTPNTPLEQVESPWNPAQGGMARIFRAVQKMTGADALPAWADLLIGLGEFVVEQQDVQTDQSQEQGPQGAGSENAEIQVT